MYVQIASQSVAAHADVLLRDYVSPFTGARGADNPLVFAGFVLSNSETGHGSFSITPRLIAQVCSNGYTITRTRCGRSTSAAGSDAGVVQWSAGTQQAAIELITRQAADATATFLTGDYLRRSLDDIEQRAGVPVRDVPATIKYVAAQCRFTDEQQTTILDHFIGGADRTAGGILQAVTSAAQVQDDADVAYEMERARAAGDDPRRCPPELVAGSGRALASPGARPAGPARQSASAGGNSDASEGCAASGVTSIVM